MKKTFITLILLVIIGIQSIDAQQKLTREQILEMTIEELSDLPLEDLMEAVETLGVSSVDELFALVMNKNVSAASKKEESAFSSPLSTSVITRQEMRTWGVSTIEEAFRLIPGVVVEEKTNGIYNIYIRGLNNIPDGQRLLYTENNNVLLMVDGRNVTNYMSGGIYTEALPVSIEDVERIEVVRGASSALYGQNAVQGVINIITEKPSSESAFVEGSVQMGNQNTVVGDVAVRGKLNNVISLGLSANAQRRDRNTDKVYLSNYRNLWYIEDETAFATASSVEEAKKYATEITGPRWVNIADLQKIKDYSSTQVGFYNIVPKQYDFNELIGDPNIARESYGINGYISLTPANNARIDITAGYQNATSMNTTTEEYKWAHGKRISKTSYVNVEASIANLHLNAGYTAGPITYATGVPGFKVRTKQMTGNIDYDFQLGDLSIRPGFGYMLTRAEDYTPGEFQKADASKGISHDGQYMYKNGEYLEVQGFFCDNAQFTVLSPSIRLDYKLNDWRFIGAYRLDKTDNPDRANHSWQFAVNRGIGQKNFIRLSYGRATRSAVLMNSDASYMYVNEGKSLPKYLYIVGNKESDLLHIDGIELGWRSRPANNLLIDAELFYSYSSDYGSLESRKSYLSATAPKMGAYLGTVAGAFMADYQAGAAETGNWATVASTLSNGNYVLGQIFDGHTVIAYSNLPYKVTQVGMSLNVDWIISSKLIAKFNANIQKTTADDFFRYSHTKSVAKQITGCMTDENKGLVTISKDYGSKVLTYAGTRAAVAQMMGQTPDMQGYVTEYIIAMASAKAGTVSQYRELAAKNPQFADNIHAALMNNVVMKGMSPSTGGTVSVDTGNGETVNMNASDLIAAYYALKYDVNIDENGSFHIANSDAPEEELQDGYEHEATPSIYGMMGLIYKPTSKFTVSAFANYIGKRTYALSIGTSDLPRRLTMNLKLAYKPIQHCEIFFNAHNLFNTRKREYAMFDKIGGLYTVGVNFNL